MFDLTIDPYLHFDRLLKEAIEKQIPEANAMSIATVDDRGIPSVRVVYMKDRTPEGFVFYGNYHSHKGLDLEENPNICLNFYWPAIWQQIRVTGMAVKVNPAESDAYWKTRPRLSQIGGWASNQSEEIPSYDHLARRVQEYEKQFEGQEIPRPPHWGGWLVVPTEIEFWFGHNGRLHERFVYRRNEEGGWSTFMRSP